MSKSFFEKMAENYDTKERIALANIVTREVRPLLQNCKDKTLLDYGSGTGLVGLALTDLMKSVVLVDSTKKMVEIVEAKIAHREIPNAEVLYADFMKENPKVKADIILLSLVLLHIPDTEKILQGLFHVLNDGGQLIIVDFNKIDQLNHPKIHNGFSHEDLKKNLIEAGFRSTEMKTFHHGKRILMNQDASLFISKSIK